MKIPTAVGLWGQTHKRGGVGQRPGVGLKDEAPGGFPHREGGSSDRGDCHEARNYPRL